MSNENLNNQEAVDKLKKLVDSIDICLFCTDVNNGKMNVAPMSRQEVDENGNIWFLAHVESHTCKNIEKDDNVVLNFANASNYEFLSVHGTATSSRDLARIDKYWNKMMEAWFEKGKEDPSIRIIQVNPSDAEFWETKDGKVITFLKVAASALTGKSVDTGNEGKLSL